MSDMVAQELWFFVDNNKKNGPYTKKQMDKLLASNSINLSTLVWKKGMQAWQALGEISDFDLKVENQEKKPKKTKENTLVVSQPKKTVVKAQRVAVEEKLKNKEWLKYVSIAGGFATVFALMYFISYVSSADTKKTLDKAESSSSLQQALKKYEDRMNGKTTFVPAENNNVNNNALAANPLVQKNNDNVEVKLFQPVDLGGDRILVFEHFDPQEDVITYQHNLIDNPFSRKKYTVSAIAYTCFNKSNNKNWDFKGLTKISDIIDMAGNKSKKVRLGNDIFTEVWDTRETDWDKTSNGIRAIDNDDYRILPQSSKSFGVMFEPTARNTKSKVSFTVEGKKVMVDLSQAGRN